MSNFLNSAANKILIFSDAHQDVEKVDKIIKNESADINLFLGDWFDSYNYDSNEDCEKTAIYLKQFISNPKNITLFGNHDLHYLFDNIYARCSGFGKRKLDIINKVFGADKNEIISRFRWFILVDQFLCSHAGLWKGFINSTISDAESLADYLHSQSLDCDIKLRTGQDHWFFGAGKARGGYQKKGGLVWLDFDQEFGEIDWIPQIVGHTFRKKRQITKWKNTNNYCIDTNLSQYLTITNGKIEIKNAIYETT